MLNIHANAEESFNKRAKNIFDFIEKIEVSKKHYPSFNPGTHPDFKINSSNLSKNSTLNYRLVDVNNQMICLYLSYV